MKLFDIEVRRKIDPASLRWPQRAEISGENAAPAGNQYYQHLVGLPWSQLPPTLAVEAKLIARIEAAENPAAEEERIIEELASADDFETVPPLRGLDIGVASPVFALSAAGAIPVASCNGGAFGLFHHGHNPYVAFFIRPRRLISIQAWAEAAGLGLVDHDGLAVLHARRIADFQIFASLALAAQVSRV